MSLHNDQLKNISRAAIPFGLTPPLTPKQPKERHDHTLKDPRPSPVRPACRNGGFGRGRPGASITRPAGYKPLVGDTALAEKLFNDTKLSNNGMSCASCHANHGAFQASIAKSYPHTVAMANEQLGRKTFHLDEMIQGCMVMPMAANPLPWDSKELIAYTASLQKSFKPSR